MLTKVDDKTLKLDGRVDTNNADELKQKLLEMTADMQEVILDLEDLEYISSAGLRSLLSLKKKFKGPLKLVNASNDIYDIFDVTGFNQILDITKKVRTLNVDNCDLIGEGANGKVYRIDNETIVKVFRETCSEDIVREELSYARSAFVSGIPTAISYDVVRCGNAYGAVYELLDAKTVSQVIDGAPETAAKYGHDMGILLKEMHSTEADTKTLKNIQTLYKDRVKGLTKFYTEDEVQRILDVYDRLSERTTLLHGDFHCKNIMLSEGEMIFIDMGDVGYGNPWLDLGGSYLGLINIGKRNPESAKHYIGIDYPLCITVWENMLKSYFDTDDIEKYTRVAEIFSDAKYTTVPMIFTGFNAANADRIVGYVRNYGFLREGYDLSALDEVEL